MLVPTRWLRDLVHSDLSPEEMAERFTYAALETNLEKDLRGKFDHVVIGRIVEKKPHPNADTLSLCRVQTGIGDQWIVCGAPNAAEGQTVVVAQVGAQLANGIKIEEKKIRGVTSNGMICSEQELGISEEAEGIIVLSEDEGTPGERFADRYPIDDAVLEIEVTPNRGDCLSVVGLARELAVITEGKLEPPELLLAESGHPVGDRIEVVIENADLCPRYSARVVENLTLGPSPFWLRLRLAMSGLRSINNIVDVTNYLMLEWGQPLHAFDLDQVAKRKIIVRNAKPEEPFTTLDGKDHTLSSEMLVITDGERPVALAGVMGGLNSGVTEFTKHVLLECAYFDPGSIRSTSRKLGIQSESSYRFERGTDWGNLINVLDRAAALIASHSGGTVTKGKIDVFPHPKRTDPVPLRPTRVNQILGTDLPPQRMENILVGLGFEVKERSDSFEVIPPTVRHDITREIDLIEEIARHYGYDKIASSLPRIQVKSVLPTRLQRTERIVQNYLRTSGFSESINYSFMNPQLLDHLRFPEDHPLRQTIPLKNPISQEWSIMRTTLLPGLLLNVALNMNRFVYDLKLFEIGKIFFPGREDTDREKMMAGAVCTESVGDSLWIPKGTKRDFFSVKGVAEGLLAELQIHPMTLLEDNETSGNSKSKKKRKDKSATVWKPGSRIPYLDSGKSLVLERDGKVCGSLGALRKEVLEQFEIRNAVYYLELDLSLVAAQSSFEQKYQSLPRFPSSRRDLALLVDRSIPTESILNLVREIGPKSLIEVELFDLYQGKPLPPDKKSVGIKLIFQDRERTLTDEEVNRIFEKIFKYLKGKIRATLREG